MFPSSVIASCVRPTDLRSRLAGEIESSTMPLPARGETLQRWQTLSTLARIDLGFAKVYESHLDAVAILSELGVSVPAGALAVYAAEPPGQSLRIIGDATGATVSGTKPWCSAAAHVDTALVTCVDSIGGRRLALVDMHRAGVQLQVSRWACEGMRGAATVDVEFREAPATLVGEAGAYTGRFGFWHGALGIAALWYGSAAAIADTLRMKASKGPHALAHLGAIDAALTGAGASLRDAARWIDEYPQCDAEHVARNVRAIVEAATEEVLQRCARALGAVPLCRNAEHAARVQDLSVFVRQSHAEKDLECLGVCRTSADAGWYL